jgi:hypothetical protein
MRRCAQDASARGRHPLHPADPRFLGLFRPFRVTSRRILRTPSVNEPEMSSQWREVTEGQNNEGKFGFLSQRPARGAWAEGAIDIRETNPYFELFQSPLFGRRGPT